MVFGQTKRTVTKKPKATVAEKEKETCANCWSGVIRYEKVLNEEINENEPVFGTTNPQSAGVDLPTVCAIAKHSELFIRAVRKLKSGGFDSRKLCCVGWEAAKTKKAS